MLELYKNILFIILASLTGMGAYTILSTMGYVPNLFLVMAFLFLSRNLMHEIVEDLTPSYAKMTIKDQD